LQSTVTKNFLKNAKDCGFESASAWRLEDKNIIDREQVRFTYIRDNVKRPAWFIFKDFDVSH
jgi:hypothetical protein